MSDEHNNTVYFTPVSGKEIIVAADTQLAKIWDTIDVFIPDGKNFLNPNNNFRTLLTNLNKNQVFIINGDIVDYFYVDHGSQESNWEFYFNLIKGSPAAILENIGNHDYRQRPY